MVSEQFEKIKNVWAKNTHINPYNSFSKKNLFELAYHSANEVPFRCIHVLTKAGEEEAGNEAVIYSSLDKIFISITSLDEGVEMTMYREKESDGFEKLEKIKQLLGTNMDLFSNQTLNIQEQIAKSILVERKIDESVNLAMEKELTRKVYFAIGEARERGALIQILMNAKGGDVVQLAIMKWMNSTMNDPQDNPFPEKKIKGLVKNFLQIKDWLIKLINKALTTSEDELLKAQDTIVENEE